MSDDAEGKETAEEGGGGPGDREALARGMLGEAVDCITQAGDAVGDDEIRASLRRCADELTELARRLASSSD